MPIKLTAAVLVLSLFLSCSKPGEDINGSNLGINPATPTAQPIPTPTPASNPTGNELEMTILVDASKDGGVWWFPQYGTYSAGLPHQGKALADYLRLLGYTVHELPRGATVTWAEIRNYKKIIRPSAFFSYSAQEIAAYDSFLRYPSALLLLSDHLQNSPNDGLSAHLGLDFIGSITGMITPFSNHAINTGVSSLPFIAGSVITHPDPSRMTILGHARTSIGGQGHAAMGILHHPHSRIFFMGDANGIEQLPQPFTANLVKWLFQ